MRPTIALILLSACTANVAGHDECNNGAACQDVETKNHIQDFPIQDQRSEDFTSDGTTYSLVRVAFGDGWNCDQDTGCDYSSYCAWVTDGTEYPQFFEFFDDTEQLFDPSLYCDDLGVCDMPGDALDINYDPDFKDWAFFTNPDDDPLVLCI